MTKAGAIAHVKRACVRALTSPGVAQLASPLVAGARAVFILSSGRCGTSSLIRVFELSQNVLALHEPSPNGAREAKRYYLDPTGAESVSREFVAQARNWRLATARIAERVYIESTNMIYLAPLLASLYPRSRFIFIHRNPADVVRSGMRRGWYVDHPWDVVRITPRKDDAAFTQWSAWGQFEKLCWFWKEVNEFILRFIETLPEERAQSMSFEQFVQGGRDAIDPLYSFTGADVPAWNSVVATIAARHNAQRSGVFPAYSAWSDRKRGILTEIAGATMQRLGYS